MPTLLPPMIVGPVSVLTRSVHVTGALSGATVTLSQNGANVGAAPAGDDGIASIDVSNVALTAGANLTAMQTSGADSSESSPQEPVLGPPASLPPLTFLTEVHACVDGIIVGGTIEGATVEVTAVGQPVGRRVAGGTQVSIRLDRPGPFPVGSTLEVRQTLTWQGNTINGPWVKSLPVQPSPDTEQSMPAPQIQAPVLECDTAVLVTGLRDGSTFTLTRSSGPATYEYYGGAVWANTAALHVPDSVSVVQEFQICRTSSPPGGPVAVTKATQLGKPVLHGPLCADTRLVTISGLRKGATLTIYVGRTTGPGASQAGLLGQASVATETQTFPLPSDLNILAGPPEYIYAYQERCGIGSPDSDQLALSGLAAAPGPPQLGQLVECARAVRVGGLAAGSTVRLSSDQADTPVLSAPTCCYATTVDIPTYRPLRIDEVVTATVTGCGAGPGSAASRSVDKVPALNPPEVHNPTRIWQTMVRVDKCVPGARIHLYVNDVWRGAADAYDDTTMVPCGTLKLEDRLTAVQTLCTEISSRSQMPVGVTLGRMKVQVQPAPITKNANPQPVTVDVQDEEDGHPVSGTISLPGGVNQPTNAQFAWTFPPGQPGPAATVHATDYEDAPVDWPL